MNSTTITSKGTTTIPKVFRDKLGLKEGSTITFSMDDANRLIVEPAIDIDELRSKNRSILRREKASLKNYKSGDGFRERARAYINER